MWANHSDRSPKMSDVSESLKLLTKNERPWAICSGRSPKMSDHERIAQVAQQKWANERIARLFKQIAQSLIFGQKTSDWLRKPISKFPVLMLTKIENIFTSWSVTLLGLIILKKVANNLVGLSLWDLYTVLHSDTESLWEMPDVNSGPVLLIYSVKYFAGLPSLVGLSP